MTFATLHTTLGRIRVELFDNHAPKTVRNFIVTALEALTGQKRGDDLAAWEGYLDSQASSEQAQQIMKDHQPKATGGKP